MTFVTLGLLIAGAGAMAIPILIHLLSRQRRRPIEWAAMRFLIEALRKHRRRIRLEQFLLLAVRCLIVLVLGAALARPILDATGILPTGGMREVVLVIDDGLASGLRLEPGEGGAEAPLTALDGTINQAVAIVEALEPGDRVGVITASRPPRELVMPPSGDLGAVARLLRGLRPREAPTDLAGALSLLGGGLEQLPVDRDQTLVYLLSDFRRGQAPLDSALPPVAVGAGARTTFLASPAAQTTAPNVRVTALRSLRGLVIARGHDGAGQVTVEVARSGDLDRDVTRVRLVGEGLGLLDPKVVNWEPGQREAQVDFNVDLAAQGERGAPFSALIEDDALPADNQRHAVLATRSRVRVLLVDRRSFGTDADVNRLSAGQWIRRALQPSDRSPMDVVEVEVAAIEPIDLRGADVAIAVRPDLLADQGWSALRSFVDGGGLLVVVPPGQAKVHPWTDQLVSAMDLPWGLALEVVEHDPGVSLAPDQPPSELLRLLSGEMTELARPVLTTRVLPVDEADTQAERILNFADGSAAAILGSPRQGAAAPGSAGAAEARGLVAYLAMSPETDWTALPLSNLMVPFFHELVRQGVGMVRAGQRFEVGQQPALGMPPTAAAMVAGDGSSQPLDAAGRPRKPLEHAGLFAVVDRAGQPLGSVAINVDEASGHTDPQSPAAVAEWLARSGPWRTYDDEDPAAALRVAQSGSPLAGALLMSLLMLVVLDTALSRWFSHARPGRTSGLTPSVSPTSVALPGAS